MHKRTKREFDVIVIGAGAAGLAAASTLAQHHLRVCLIEARDRIGGRIFTRMEPDIPIGLELGAEFVHGRSPVVAAWLSRNNSFLIDASQTRFSFRDGKLENSDRLFETMKSGLERIAKPTRDLAFADFLGGPARRVLGPQARTFARTLVEGFDAADATQVSTLDVLQEWSGSSAADAPTFRPRGGYGELVSAIALGLDPANVQLHLNTRVTEVAWSTSGVNVGTVHFGADESFRAGAVIVTLPLGVLQLPAHAADAVRFDPPLRSKQRALNALGSGPVIKILLHFREAFWEKLQRGRYRDAAFFHAAGSDFPTFWTSLPMRTSVLSAWCAGPNATRLSGLDESQLVARALNSLDTLFGKRRLASGQLQAAFVHDWQADPFACGAYSFVRVGGAFARRALARPVDRTLYFAGEATDTGGEAATVGGALNSGERAARSLVRDHFEKQSRSRQRRRRP